MDSPLAHVPLRTCTGCRRVAPRSTLVRLVAAGDQITVDPSGSAPGRGAYVHAEPACLATALKRRALSRALRTRAEPAQDLARQLAVRANGGDTR